MKKHFITGLIVLLPIALTFWIVSFIVGLLTNPFLGIAESLLRAIGLHNVSIAFLSSDQVLHYCSVVLVLIFLFVLIIGIGIVGRYFLFKYIFKIGDSILHRIPLISSVYKTSQELISTILTTSNKSFKQVVSVPYPHESARCVGLLTRDDFTIEKRVAVFIPTTPNPTSGFLVLFEPKDITPLDMTVEEALRYVISCGVLMTPTKNEHHTLPPTV